MASDSEDYEESEEELEEEDEEYEDRRKRKKRRGGAAAFIDDAAEEDDEEDDEEERPRSKKRKGASAFIDDETAVASDDDDDEEEPPEDDFMDDAAEDLGNEPRANFRRMPRPEEEEEMDEEQLAQYLQRKYNRNEAGADDVDVDVEQQANLPSVKDPKLWLIKCQLGREREAAISMMQKYLNKEQSGDPLLIKSVIALDHLKGYVYVESEKEAYVKKALQGMRVIYGSAKAALVPIKEMTEVLKVSKKQADVSRDQWVRVRNGVYKGDLGQVVDMDHIKQQAIVKLVPRLDLPYVAAKLAGEEIERKRNRMQPRFLNVQEVKDLRIPIERIRDRETGEYVDTFNGWKFQNGYFLKPCSLRSLITSGVVPTFDELQKFQRQSSEDEDRDALPSLPVSNLKQRKTFVVGDSVQVTAGDLQNLRGVVEHVNLEDDTVIIKPVMAVKKGEKPLDAVQVPATDLRKFWTVGHHVKVLAGQHEGTTGLIVGQDRDTVILLSDATQTEVKVFAHDVQEAAEVASGLTKFHEFDLHDLVRLDQQTVGMIIKVDRDACQVLVATPDKQELRTIRRPQIKCKVFDRNYMAQDGNGSVVSVKDVARVIRTNYKGKQGTVDHMYRGTLFIHCRDVIENGGYICIAARNVQVLGGKKAFDPRGEMHMGGMGMGGPFRPPLYAPQAHMRSPVHYMQSPSRIQGPPPGIFGGGQRGHRRDDGLTGRIVKIKTGPWKGYKGKVKDATDVTVRVELDSQMKTVTVRRDQLVEGNLDVPRHAPDRYAEGSQTPMHYPKTPMHPSYGNQTPGRDPLATPMRDSMRTPGRDQAWNPQTPHRSDNGWAEEGPGWAPAGDYQAPPAYVPYVPAEPSPGPPDPSTPGNRPYDAGTPSNGWASGYGKQAPARTAASAYGGAATPGLPSTPGLPTTPGTAPNYPATPSTPGVLPSTPGDFVGDPSSPAFAGDFSMEGEGKWPLPDILVSVGQSSVGVVREVLPDGSCKVQLGAAGDGELVTAGLVELDVVPLKKNDRIKIVKGDMRGSTGKLIGIDGADGIVKMDDNLDIKILDLSNLAKFVTS